MAKRNKKKLNPAHAPCCPLDAAGSPVSAERVNAEPKPLSVPNQEPIPVIGASPPEPTPQAAAEYVSPSQPLAEKPKFAKPRQGRAVVSRTKKAAHTPPPRAKQTKR